MPPTLFRARRVRSVARLALWAESEEWAEMAALVTEERVARALGQRALAQAALVVAQAGPVVAVGGRVAVAGEMVERVGTGPLVL
jgi:hypothetical protein